MSSAGPLTEIRLDTVDELIVRLGVKVSPRWIAAQCNAGRFDCTMVGRERRFTEENYAQIVAACLVPAVNKLPERKLRRVA